MCNKATSDYQNHWVIATREHLDRYHQPVFRAQPIATLAGEPPEFDAAPGTNGLKLQLGVSGDTVSACGGWSCPEFFEAFESGL